MSLINWFDGLLPALFDKIENPILSAVMCFFTKLGNGGVLWILAIVAMLLVRRHSKAGLASASSLATCFVFGNYILKPLIGRVRPCNVYTNLELLIERPLDFSFPSMHTATSFSVAILLYRYDKRMGIPAIVVASLISISRVYLHVHYTTDVIAGAVLGTAFALLFYWLFFEMKRKDI